MKRILISLGLILLLRAAPPALAADLSTQTLQHQIIDTQSKIHAWLIEYQSTGNDPSVDLPGKSVHRTVAALSPDRFYHWGAHATARYPWPDDPYQQRLILNGPTATIEFPFARSFHQFSLNPTDPLPGTAPQEFIFLALGWWPWPDKPAPKIGDQTPCVLRDIAQSPDYHSAGSELHAGRPCNILEYPRHDRLWFDADRPGILVGRQITDPATGNLLQQIDLTDFRPLAPGLWFPMQWHNTLFNGSEKPFDSTITVLNARLNDQVPPSLFEFTPSPGAVQIFDDGHYQQSAPGGFDYLDSLLAWINRQSPPQISTPSYSHEAILEYALCAVTALWLLRRWSRA